MKGTRQEKGQISDKDLRNDILYKKNNGDLLYVVPKSLLKAFAIKYHDVVKKISNYYYYFPRIRRYIRQHIKACLHCEVTETKTVKQASELPIKIIQMNN